MAEPQLSVIVTTFERPHHLRRALAALSRQRGLSGGFEVIVVDDGSRDSTPQVIAEAERNYSHVYRLTFLTHPHDGFHPARSRNQGIAAARGEYLVFLDGDCVAPADHLATYVACRKPGEALAGDGYWLDEPTSQRITFESILRGDAWPEPTDEQRKAVSRRHRKFIRDRWLRAFRLRRIAEKPGLKGANFGAWRSDCERINGFDENYRGWGCEDDDFGARLRQSGVRIDSIMKRTLVYHLWHPPTSTTPRLWKDIMNREYFLRKDRPERCANGLVKKVHDARVA